MARNASTQFTVFTSASARSYLENATQDGMSHGDRLAAQRRLQPVTSEEERLKLRTYLLSLGQVVFPWQFPDGDWPYTKTPVEQEAKTAKSEFDEWLDGVTSEVIPEVQQVNEPTTKRILPW